MSLGREEEYHPISSLFLFFTSFSPVHSLTPYSPPPPLQKLPYDCVHYANECLTGVMASGGGGERDEEGLKETKMNKINNLDGQLKLPRPLFS
jgi:hypothetical protein